MFKNKGGISYEMFYNAFAGLRGFRRKYYLTWMDMDVHATRWAIGITLLLLLIGLLVSAAITTNSPLAFLLWLLVGALSAIGAMLIYMFLKR